MQSVPVVTIFDHEWNRPCLFVFDHRPWITRKDTTRRYVVDVVFVTLICLSFPVLQYRRLAVYICDTVPAQRVR